MGLQRVKHWDTREFTAHLKTHASSKFVWGVNDCGLFAATAIQSFTDVDIAADFRGKYTDAATAAAFIRTLTGGTTVADAAAWCAAKHGMVEYVYPLCAQRGDLVVMKQNAADAADQLLAGVVHLSGAHLVTVGEAGLVRVSILNVVRAWKV
jgi:hypothetical protein